MDIEEVMENKPSRRRGRGRPKKGNNGANGKETTEKKTNEIKTKKNTKTKKKGLTSAKAKNTKNNGDSDLGSGRDGKEEAPSERSRATCYSLKGSKRVKEKHPPLKRRRKRDDNGNIIESLMCHQCQRNDKGRVVRCQTCKTKRFCIPCLQRWYPDTKEEAIAEACPVCRGNCNCKACLRLEGSLQQELNNLKMEISEDEKVRHSMYLLHELIPFLKQFNREQLMEKEIEAKIRGLSLAALKLQKAACDENERVYCNCCKTSIVDFHRSCPNCFYDLCLTCCWEIRDGHLQGGGKEVIFQYINNGSAYLHGGKPSSVSSRTREAVGISVDKSSTDYEKSNSEWKVKKDGSIPCPPEKRGGCGVGLLELMSRPYPASNGIGTMTCQ